MNNDGANIEMRDSRVTSVAQWFWNIVGGLMVLALAFVANNLYQVNLTLAANAVTTQSLAAAIAENRAHLDRHDVEIGQLQRDVISVGGPSYRGGDFTPPEQRRRGH